MSDYYAYRQIPVMLRGEPALMVGKPGVWSWDEVNPGTAALIEALDLRPGERVLDLGCGTGLLGLTAARLTVRHGGQVRLIDVNVAAVACAQKTLEANGVVNAEVQLAAGVGAEDVGAFDLVLSHLPRGREAARELIRGAAAALAPGGRFYLVAHKRAGVRSAIAYAAQVLGRAGVVRQKQGYHVALAVKEQSQPWTPPEYARFAVTLDGAPATLVSRPGVFAWDRVDDGTRALVGAMEIRSGEEVLDLGCGAGLLALAAARRSTRLTAGRAVRQGSRQGQVTAVDADLRAVESARYTLEANETQAETLISDCAQAVLERRFDVVLCNPPFHQGVGVAYDVARQMARDAAAVLRPGGRFYLVSNAFIRYEREMDRFSQVREVFNDRRYRVLRARH